MRRLGKHMFVETNFDWANVGAAVFDDGIILLDCPVRPSDSRRWQEELRSLSPRGLRYLIATDYHGDHTTGSAFVEGVTFIAPKLAYEEIARQEGKHPFSKQIFIDTLRDLGQGEEADEIAKATVPLPHICFDDELFLHLPPLTFEIRRLGGHTSACSVVYVPEESVIFTGDVVINEPCPGMRDANLGQWLEALGWIETLPVDHIVPGHGEICGKEEVRKLKEYLTGVREAMEKLVQAGQSMAEAVADSAFDKFFWADPSRGAYWAEERKGTFRRGLETVYKEVKGA